MDLLKLTPKKFWYETKDKFKGPKYMVGKTSIRYKDKTYRRYKAGYSPDDKRMQKEEGDPKCFSCECGTSWGQYHELGCDCEDCPICKGQLLSCGHLELFRRRI